MICPNCGCEITGNYCSNCGMPLKTAEDGSYSDAVTREHGWESPDRIPEYENHENIEDIRTLRLSRDEAAPRPHRSRKRAEGSPNTRGSKKEMQKKDTRLKKMENELGQLRTRAEESRKSLERMETLRRENDERNPDRNPGRNPDDTEKNRNREIAYDSRADQTGETLQMVKAAGAGALVLISRLMQLGSALLMAAMTAVMAHSFWAHGQALGDIRYLVEESNYDLALYAGFAGISIFMGMIWCFWILSKKGAGGGLRMKKYDIGRGFVPFLLCMAVVVATGMLLLKLPADAAAWDGHLKGAYSALEAISAHRNGLFFCSVLGAVLSFIRKLLRV